MNDSARQWDAEYASGRWDFLDNSDQQMRHAVMAAMIATYGNGHVVDLGCGPGHLLNWIKPDSITSYTGVDMSETAMDKMPEVGFPVTKIVGDLSAYDPAGAELGTLVASEVLYFLDDAGAEMARIIEACSRVSAFVVSLVAAREDKPNWGRSANRVWQSLDKQGWRKLETVEMHNQVTGNGWTVALYLPE